MGFILLHYPPERFLILFVYFDLRNVPLLNKFGKLLCMKGRRTGGLYLLEACLKTNLPLGALCT